LAAPSEHTVHDDPERPLAVHVNEIVVTSRAEAKQVLAAMREGSRNGNGA